MGLVVIGFGLLIAALVVIGGLWLGITGFVDSVTGKISNWSIFDIIAGILIFIIGVALFLGVIWNS